MPPSRWKKERGVSISLDVLCKAMGIPAPEAEYRFAPPRRWRFDYAWPQQKLALEVQGGLFVQGRHSRGAALLKEHEKLNTAASMGWRIVYCTPKQAKDGSALEIVRISLGYWHQVIRDSNGRQRAVRPHDGKSYDEHQIQGASD